MDLQTTYLHILLDTLKKKRKVLEDIYEITRHQAEIMKEESIQTEALDESMDKKAECLKVLNQLDDGFEMLYAKVREELQASPGSYQEEVMQLKQLVNLVMDLSVSIQALEQKNKMSMERYFLRHRKNIQTCRSSQKRVNEYYNAMTGLNPHQSFFLDSKK